MDKSIRISKEFGVNPSVQICHCCGKDMGVVLFGTSYKDENGKTAQAPSSISTGDLCDNCKAVIENGGVFCIEVRKGSNHKNPYRTGRLVGIKKEAAIHIFDENVKSINYVEEEAFEQIFGEFLRNHQEN